MLCSKKGVFFQSPRCSHLHLLSREKMHAVLGCGSKSVHGDIIQKDIRNIAHSHTLCSTPHTHTHFTANKVLPASSGQAPDHTHTHTHVSLVIVWHVSVSSQSVVVCELPLLKGVSAFTWIQVQGVPLRPRLQAHVAGHKLWHEVLRLHKEKKKKKLFIIRPVLKNRHCMERRGKVTKTRSARPKSTYQSGVGWFVEPVVCRIGVVTYL